jgi:hypothetical protein
VICVAVDIPYTHQLQQLSIGTSTAQQREWLYDRNGSMLASCTKSVNSTRNAYTRDTAGPTSSRGATLYVNVNVLRVLCAPLSVVSHVSDPLGFSVQFSLQLWRQIIFEYHVVPKFVACCLRNPTGELVSIRGMRVVRAYAVVFGSGVNLHVTYRGQKLHIHYVLRSCMRSCDPRRWTKVRVVSGKRARPLMIVFTASSLNSSLC